MNETFCKLQPYLEKQLALGAALRLFDWDNATQAPTAAIENSATITGILSNELYAATINPGVESLLKSIENEDLSPTEAAIVKALKKDFDDIRPIPQQEYSAFTTLITKAQPVWAKARKNNDYATFAPVLGEIISYNKKFAAYKAKSKGFDGPLYDILLDDYEKGFNQEILDDFFAKLKDAIVPLVKMVSSKNGKIDKSYNYQKFDTETQRRITREIAEYVGFDFEKGVIAESAHPFTTNLHNKDVRITTAYLENNLESALFSTIHESGHALYELHIDDDISMSPVGTGTSIGFHEGQSRLFENNLGRSHAFWKPIYHKLQEAYPEQLKDVSLEHFILGINKSAPSLIRTEADELTYCLHIMVRYEMEKEIINGDIDVNDLPQLWNDKYEEYLGVRPSNDSEGILQDIHWAGGSFGYFPSYAIGTAIAAQIYAHLKEAIDVDACLENGDFNTINAYLKEKLHRFGATKTTNELLQNMMGEDFNPKYYIEYLTEKYNSLYKNL